MPWDEISKTYKRDVNHTVDATPGGDNVKEAVDEKNNKAIGDLNTDLNHHQLHGKHGLSGDLVGTVDDQKLTNKTFGIGCSVELENPTAPKDTEIMTYGAAKATGGNFVGDAATEANRAKAEADRAATEHESASVAKGGAVSARDEAENFADEAMRAARAGVWTPEIRSVAYASPSAFTVTGDVRSIYVVGRKVQLTQAAPAVGLISTVELVGGDTRVTVAGAIVSADLSAVAYGIPQDAMPQHVDYNAMLRKGVADLLTGRIVGREGRMKLLYTGTVTPDNSRFVPSYSDVGSTSVFYNSTVENANFRAGSVDVVMPQYKIYTWGNSGKPYECVSAAWRTSDNALRDCFLHPKYGDVVHDFSAHTEYTVAVYKESTEAIDITDGTVDVVEHLYGGGSVPFAEANVNIYILGDFYMSLSSLGLTKYDDSTIRIWTDNNYGRVELFEIKDDKGHTLGGFSGLGGGIATGGSYINGFSAAWDGTDSLSLHFTSRDTHAKTIRASLRRGKPISAWLLNKFAEESGGYGTPNLGYFEGKAWHSQLLYDLPDHGSYRSFKPTRKPVTSAATLEVRRLDGTWQPYVWGDPAVTRYAWRTASGCSAENEASNTWFFNVAQSWAALGYRTQAEMLEKSAIRITYKAAARQTRLLGYWDADVKHCSTDVWFLASYYGNAGATLLYELTGVPPHVGASGNSNQSTLTVGGQYTGGGKSRPVGVLRYNTNGPRYPEPNGACFLPAIGVKDGEYHLLLYFKELVLDGDYGDTSYLLVDAETDYIRTASDDNGNVHRVGLLGINLGIVATEG